MVLREVAAAKTVNSVRLTKWGIERLQQNLQQHGNEHANLLSCMTLDVENLHSAVVHHKSHVSKAFQCARNFDRTAREGLKRTAYIELSTSTPVEAHGMWSIWSLITWSIRHSGHAGNLHLSITASSGLIAEMREWSRTYGASVRQRSVR